MEWSQVINNPFLKDLPFKIELNKWGKILMSPASNNHGHLQFEVGAKIRDGKQGHGKIITECSIHTSQGVKVADVAWISDEFFAQYGYETPYKRAPEICVEIVSPSNSKEEMEEKIELYLAKGAKEVWIVREKGGTEFYTYEGKIEKSLEMPD
ncbi:MAG: Uma2 family endonuclease [Candidatus Electrothrix aestuarii]|uniref:Uma2 family endonuclease n=1 Tax=Candidatus Electrothrix aestuarii TaxID=3062594 RepID=A0AAU8LSA8_9BACT|nr:Uma2 family endonuclease [Candidatus Electrothrix aestuarii]